MPPYPQGGKRGPPLRLHADAVSCHQRGSPGFSGGSRMNLDIRDMRPEDADGKGYVHYTSWQETYRGLIPDACLAKRTLERCREAARRWPENTLVADLDGKIIGFACYGVCRDEDLSGCGEVITLYVLKEFQGIGIGKKLMDAAL